jgi:hypothetical protein
VVDRAKELAQDFPETPGASVRMQQVITGAPEGEVKYYTVIQDGKTLDSSWARTPRGPR